MSTNASRAPRCRRRSWCDGESDMKRALIPMFALLLGTASARADDAALKAGVFDPPRAAPEFTLAGSNGADLKLSDYRGKVVLLGFGFTQCKAVCPITLGTLAQAQKKLGDAARDLQVIYITVDPENDTAAQLKTYLAHFSKSFVGGTGSDAQLAAVRK